MSDDLVIRIKINTVIAPTLYSTLRQISGYRERAKALLLFAEAGVCESIASVPLEVKVDPYNNEVIRQNRKTRPLSAAVSPKQNIPPLQPEFDGYTLLSSEASNPVEDPAQHFGGAFDKIDD